MELFIILIALVIFAIEHHRADKKADEAYKDGYREGVDDTRKFYENLRKSN